MKRYIVGMSLERDTAMHQISSFSPVIMEHMIKLMMYSDIRPNDVRGWTHTVAYWIQKADDVTVKPHAKKLKKQDIISSLFSCMGDDVRDYERALYSFLADNKSGKFNSEGKGSYLDFEVDEEAAYHLMNLCYGIIEVTLPLLLDKLNHDVPEYESAVRRIIENLR